MKKMEKDRETDAVEQKIREAFGFDEEQILQEFHMAEEAICDEDLPETPADDFERLLARIEADHDTNPADILEPIKEHKKNHKRKRIIKMRRVMVLVAALVIATLGMSIVGVGGKNYYFKITERDSNESANDVKLNNDEVSEKLTDEEEAYKQIENQLNMDVLKLGNRPEGMKFEKFYIEGHLAYLIFSLNDSYLYLYQTNVETGASINIKYHGAEIGSCTNEWLNEEIAVQAQENDSGWEYASRLTRENSYVMIEGFNLELDEFLEIVADLHY